MKTKTRTRAAKFEAFYVSAREFILADSDTWEEQYMDQEKRLALDPDPAVSFSHDEEEMASNLQGWYYRCLPNSEPRGPFTTRAKALADARQRTGRYRMGSETALVSFQTHPHGSSCDATHRRPRRGVVRG